MICLPRKPRRVPWSRWLCGILLLAHAGWALSVTSGRSATGATARVTPLLLISIDGYRADYLQRGLSPVLQALADRGVRAAWMEPSFPSLTFPNHYTLVTGLRPDHHGIVNNSMRDDVLGAFSLHDRRAVGDGRWWAGGTPLWETADAHGLRTATLFWPGSEAAVHGHRPDNWKPFDARVTPDQRVDRILAWLDRPAARRPAFLTLYFDAVDHAGHLFGPDSAQVDRALRQTDAALGRLLRGLRRRGIDRRINLIVLSDHGMAGVPADHQIPIDQRLALDQVQTVSLGVLAGFNPRSASTVDRRHFAAIEQAMERPQAHLRCWDKTRVPARLDYGHHPRVPQLLCLADSGWRITTSAAVAQSRERSQAPHLGEHGYDNADPLMRALFIAHGPAFRRGIVVPAFPNVDVYPLMAHLLRLPPASNDGDYTQVRAMLVPVRR